MIGAAFRKKVKHYMLFLQHGICGNSHESMKVINYYGSPKTYIYIHTQLKKKQEFVCKQDSFCVAIHL